MMQQEIYEAFALLFSPPGPSFDADLRRLVELCEEPYPAAASALLEFAEFLPKGDLLAQQELHTRTFDVQAITSLDVGYTLFGEDYKRGAMLANLSHEHTKVENDCGLELADHLTNVLRLLPKWQDHAVREEFVHVLLAPALREMIREFEPERLEKKEELYKKHHKTIIESASGPRRTAYLHTLLALQVVLNEDFGIKVRLPIERESKFIVSVGAEMGIEGGGSSCPAK